MDLAAGSVAPAGGPGTSNGDLAQDDLAHDDLAHDDPDHLRCESCGEPNPERARFCSQCGMSLVREAVSHDPEARHDPWAIVGPVGSATSRASVEGLGEDPTAPVVTAVVCEVLGPAPPDEGAEPVEWDSPTALAEVLDVFERYGGSVEELPGSPNALVAVFGPEPPGGDGPLRAVRAAAEIRAVVPAEVENPSVMVRAGVGASQVMGDGPDAARLWRGRVVDLAIRLQRMAEPGEVIVGEGVFRRIGNAAEVQPVDGRSRIDGDGPVGPLRLLDVAPDPSVLALAESPLAGRDRELATLHEVYERVSSQRACSLLWVLGDAGVGRTRLVEELLRGVEDQATVVRVRCRASSEGGTTWPLADVVERVAGVTDGDPPSGVREKVENLVQARDDAQRIVERLLPLLGVPGGWAAPEETPWALRRLLEAVATERPLALLLDDVERAGPGFAHLLRDVTRRVDSAPILIVCTGPAELEPDDEGEAEVLRLGPLAEADVAALAERLLANPDLPSEIRDAVAQSSRGNPLVAEQVVALLIDEGHLRFDYRRWVPASDATSFDLPDGIGPLLESRLGRLELDERAVIGLAAVVGETFPWDLMAELVPEHARAGVRDRLTALSAKRLLRAEGSDASAFRHAQIREAAAAEVPADVAAVVHERYAEWVDQTLGERARRHAELVGAHLEAASRARRASAQDAELSRRASGLLAAAAAAASDVGDSAGAVQLWLRATSLLPPTDRDRPALLVETARAMADADPGTTTAEGLLTQAARAARTSDDRAVECRAKLLRATLELQAAEDHEAIETVREGADAAIAVCGEEGDELGLAWAWSARALVHRRQGYFAGAAEAAERAAGHARGAGRRRDEVAALLAHVRAIEDGPAPLEESVERCRAALERVRGERPAELEIEGTLALLLARAGRPEEARELAERATAAAEDLGIEREVVASLDRTARIELLAGHTDEAERTMRRALEAADRLGDGVLGAQIAASLAHVAYESGRTEEAQELTEVAERAAAPDDVRTQVAWRTARAKVLARNGRASQAKALTRAAVQLAEQTDLIELRAGALLDVAEVLRLFGRPNEASPFARKARRMLERKGAEAPAARARAFLERFVPRHARRAEQPVDQPVEQPVEQPSAYAEEPSENAP